jgi:hypothetical protein
VNSPEFSRRGLNSGAVSRFRLNSGEFSYPISPYIDTLDILGARL